MNHFLLHRHVLPVSVRTRLAIDDLFERVEQAWDERHDESGIDEAVTKMIWLAVGITVALAAGAFFTTVFESARDSVPNPVTP